MLLDLILGWAVIAFPFILAVLFIFIPAKSDDEVIHMRWRRGLVPLGIIFSALAWWQQSRAIHAATTDRDKAIQETSTRVATETSKQVTKALAEQYGQQIVDQKRKIDDLQSQLVAQGKDVTIIKRSNIVTGKNPVKVEITNPALPQSDSDSVPGVNWTEEKSENVEGKPAVLIKFRIDRESKMPAFIAVCDRPCTTVGASVQGVSQVKFLSSNEPTVAGVLYITPRPLGSGILCFLTIVSRDENPVTITAFRTLRESEIPLSLR